MKYSHPYSHATGPLKQNLVDYLLGFLLLRKRLVICVLSRVVDCYTPKITSFYTVVEHCDIHWFLLQQVVPLKSWRLIFAMVYYIQVVKFTFHFLWLWLAKSYNLLSTDFINCICKAGFSSIWPFSGQPKLQLIWVFTRQAECCNHQRDIISANIAIKWNATCVYVNFFIKH